MSVHHMCSVHRHQKRAPDPLELELQMVVSHHVAMVLLMKLWREHMLPCCAQTAHTKGCFLNREVNESFARAQVSLLL